MTTQAFDLNEITAQQTSAQTTAYLQKMTVVAGLDFRPFLSGEPSKLRLLSSGLEGSLKGIPVTGFNRYNSHNNTLDQTPVDSATVQALARLLAKGRHRAGKKFDIIGGRATSDVCRELVDLLAHYFPQLEELCLLVNEITNVDGFKGLTALTELDLATNPIVRLEGLREMPLLRSLVLSNCRIVDIPSYIRSLSELTQLKELNLANNYLENTDGLETLTGLQKLVLGGNHNIKLGGIMGLTQLTGLSLWNTGYAKRTLRHFVQLTSLDMSQNPLDDDDVRRIARCERLEKLVLHEC